MDSWNVPRTPLSSFPEAHQEIIRDGRGRRAAGRAGPPAAPTPTQAAVDKALRVLAYEESAGLADVRGSSGERFSEWMARSLAALGNELDRGGHPGLAGRCVEAARALEGYGAGVGGSAARAAAAAAATAALTLVAHELQDHPHHLRTGRYGGAVGSEKVNKNGGPAPAAPESDDVAAAEAHAEETAVTGAAAAAADALEAPPPPPAEPDADGYVLAGNRRIKASTLAFRESFAAAAAAQVAGASAVSDAVAAGGEQRTAAWLALRERRLTASAFSKALGFFEGDRQSLWEEKVGLSPPFAGNEATAWGTAMEPAALDAYQRFTGQDVEACMFRVKHEDPPHSWLGASPDGLVQGLVIPSGTAPAPAAPGPSLAGPGVLEIKCPFNRGRPDEADPPRNAIWYYMPQMQGLMDIFDREWCCLYVWTRSRGSAAFTVPRDRAYWAAAFEVLGEFWWAHTVPARQARDAGAAAAVVEAFRPAPVHPASQGLKEWSKRLALAAPRTYFPPETGGQGPGAWGRNGGGSGPPQEPQYRRKT